MAVALALLPPVQARAKAALVLGEAVGAGIPRPFAASVERRRAHLDGVAGDLYLPGGPAPAVVLLPGAAPEGPGDPRVVRVATATARAGRVVFVPELDLARATFVAADIDRIVRVVAALAAAGEVSGEPGHRVAMLGFSFGGSFALLAAADPRARPHVSVVATFGSYVDLRGLLQAATTGTWAVEERRAPWQAHPRAREVVREVSVELVAPGERAALRAALAGETGRAELPAGAGAAYDLVTNSDPDRTFALAERLDPTGRELLARFSPATVARELPSVPVLALHSRDDPLVPYGELLRLHTALPHARTGTVDSFRHVDLAASDTVTLLRDVATLWGFGSRLLAAQERFLD